MKLLKNNFKWYSAKMKLSKWHSAELKLSENKSFYVDNIFWKYYREIHYGSWNILPEVQDLHKNWISNL